MPFVAPKCIMNCPFNQHMHTAGGNAFGIRALQKVAGILAAFPKKITSTAEVKNVAGVGKASIQKV